MHQRMVFVDSQNENSEKNAVGIVIIGIRIWFGSVVK